MTQQHPSAAAQTADSVPGLAAAATAVRESNPLVQCITNTVVQWLSANALLAVGASPAMINHEADAAQFARISDGLLINFGTASSHNFLAADAAITAARETGTPWVLDPVSYGVIDYRTTRIKQALTWQPTAIRGNASEIAALAGTGVGARGVDSTDEVEAVLEAAIQLSHALGSVVAVSGEVDAIVHAGKQVRIARVSGGSDYMPLVVGTGCSLGGVVAAYLGAVPSDPFAAVVAAHAHYSAAGTRAAETSRGPGSFAVEFLDALHSVTAADIAAVGVSYDTVEVTA